LQQAGSGSGLWMWTYQRRFVGLHWNVAQSSQAYTIGINTYIGYSCPESTLNQRFSNCLLTGTLFFTYDLSKSTEIISVLIYASIKVMCVHFTSYKYYNYIGYWLMSHHIYLEQFILKLHII